MMGNGQGESGGVGVVGETTGLVLGDGKWAWRGWWGGGVLKWHG